VLAGSASPRMLGLHAKDVEDIIFLENWQDSDTFREDPAFLSLLAEMNREELERKAAEQKAFDDAVEARIAPIRRHLSQLKWIFPVISAFLIVAAYLVGAY
jgi:hypothetical protein